jgi:hypothetical protein
MTREEDSKRGKISTEEEINQRKFVRVRGAKNNEVDEEKKGKFIFKNEGNESVLANKETTSLFKNPFLKESENKNNDNINKSPQKGLFGNPSPSLFDCNFFK